MRQNNICFLHCYTINNYLQILDELLYELNKNNNLLNKITICVVGSSNLDSYKSELVDVIYISESYNHSENETISYMQECVKKMSDDNNILYCHVKGVTDPKNKNFIAWRRYMMFFTIKNMQNNINVLNNYDTCGVDLKSFPVKHYSGNFWWATAKYLKTLSSVYTIDNNISFRHNAEFWVCSNKLGKHYSFHNDNKDKKFNLIKTEEYENIIFRDTF